MPTLEEVVDLARQLTTEQRRELAAQILRDMETPFADPDVDLAWAVEVQKRLDDVRSGRVKTVAWTEARKQIFGDNTDHAKPN